MGDEYANITDGDALARSLTADDRSLLPHLPYLLQDLEELGTPFAAVGPLFAENVPSPGGLRVLDLACGKGAVGVGLAREFGCRVTMVDAFPEFIASARKRAAGCGVLDRCSFAVEDIRRTAGREGGWDCVRLLAAGDVLGNPAETMAALSRMAGPDGWVAVDETYGRSSGQAVRFAYDYPVRGDWLRAYEAAGLRVVARDDAPAWSAENDADCRAIAKRAGELAERFPEMAGAFRRYVENQEAESRDLDDSLESFLCLLRKTGD